jgi:hypothetical protein
MLHISLISFHHHIVMIMEQAKPALQAGLSFVDSDENLGLALTQWWSRAAKASLLISLPFPWLHIRCFSHFT